jgi:hypothetical protein
MHWQRAPACPSHSQAFLTPWNCRSSFHTHHGWDTTCNDICTRRLGWRRSCRKRCPGALRREQGMRPWLGTDGDVCTSGEEERSARSEGHRLTAKVARLLRLLFFLGQLQRRQLLLDLLTLRLLLLLAELRLRLRHETRTREMRAAQNDLVPRDDDDDYVLTHDICGHRKLCEPKHPL